MMALNYLHLGSVEDASLAAETAQTLDPESAQSSFTLLKVHLRQQLIDKGMISLHQHAGNNPNLSGARYAKHHHKRSRSSISSACCSRCN